MRFGWLVVGLLLGAIAAFSVMHDKPPTDAQSAACEALCTGRGFMVSRPDPEPPASLLSGETMLGYGDRKTLPACRCREPVPLNADNSQTK